MAALSARNIFVLAFSILLGCVIFCCASARQSLARSADPFRPAPLRHLSKAQIAVLTSSIRGRKLEFNLIYAVDPRTAKFGAEFDRAFAKAHAHYVVVIARKVVGLHGVSLYDPERRAGALASALREAKIAFRRTAKTPYLPATPALVIAPERR